MSLVTAPEEMIRRVRELAAAQAAVNPAEVSLDSHFEADLNYDSLDQVEFTMTLEDEFGVSIDDERAEKIQTVGEAVELLLTVQREAASRSSGE